MDIPCFIRSFGSKQAPITLAIVM
uniref:Uncharacterized protein n=1 Tax=Rhizophora mucronata TaxID=61149 RepID=A0A2P2IVB3_RHIMU